MITTKNVNTSTAAQIVRKGTLGAPEGSEKWQVFSTPALSRLVISGSGEVRCQPFHTALDVFNLIPAASAAAGKDDLLLTLGTGTEVVARASKGGVNIKSQATTPAQNDNVMLIPVTGSTMIVPITAASMPRFSCRINLTQISQIIASAGLNETQTSPDPTAAAGDGACFLFAPDPGGSGTALTTPTGLASSTQPNWILHQKVAGADTFIDSGWPVVAGQDYELAIVWDASLTPTYYINGNQVGIGAAANTSGSTPGVVVGESIASASPAGQIDMDVRFVAVERFIG